MPCYYPQKAWRSKCQNRSGKRSLVFSERDAVVGCPGLTIPCGQCIGCRLEKSRQWAMRCLHEAKMHSSNCMITLTYDQEHLPEHSSLRKRDFQLFMKRLRKHVGKKLRVYPCGEYGERFQRPHYHACIFGWEPPDKVPVRITGDGTHYTSKSLESIWGKGRVESTDLNFKTAAYVARYILKKKTGKAKQDYTTSDPATGEVLAEREPEFSSCMSRRPGIGRTWLDQYRRDVYPLGYVVVNGVKCQPPKYYENNHELLYPEEIEKIKMKRVDIATKNSVSSARLTGKERCARLKLEQLKRNYENENIRTVRFESNGLQKTVLQTNARGDAKRAARRRHG